MVPNDNPGNNEGRQSHGELPSSPSSNRTDSQHFGTAIPPPPPPTAATASTSAANSIHTAANSSPRGPFQSSYIPSQGTPTGTGNSQSYDNLSATVNSSNASQNQGPGAIPNILRAAPESYSANSFDSQQKNSVPRIPAPAPAPTPNRGWDLKESPVTASSTTEHDSYSSSNQQKYDSNLYNQNDTAVESINDKSEDPDAGDVIQPKEKSKRSNSIKTFFSGRKSHESKRSKEQSLQIEPPQPQGPEHILNTILEEDVEDDQSVLIDLKAAQEDFADANTINSASRRRGYKANLQRHRRIRRNAASSPVVRFLRSLYRDILSKSLATRLIIWWFPLALILFIPLAVDAFGPTALFLGKCRVAWIFIWLEVAWGTLFVAKIFSHYMPEILGFIVSVCAPEYFRYIDAFVALENPLTLVLWTLISMITFIPVVVRNPHSYAASVTLQWQKVINDILVAFLICALLYFFEQVFLHFLSISFHRTRMAIRIANNKKSVNILVLLLYSCYEFFPPGCDEFADEDEILRSTIAATSQNAKNIKAKLKSKMSGLKVPTLRSFGQTSEKNQAAAAAAAAAAAGEPPLPAQASAPNLDQQFNPQIAPTKTSNRFNNAVNRGFENITSFGRGILSLGSEGSESPEKVVRQALPNKAARNALANRIWKSLVMEDEEELTFEDVQEILGPDKRDEALYIFDILDRDGQGGIDLDEMVASVRDIGKEQKNISKSLRDMGQCIAKLHSILLILLLIIVIIVFVGMLSTSASTVIGTLGSTLISLSFIFSTTCQEILSSCVFVFAKHPYDVGDMTNIYVANVGLQRMRVASIALLSTVFIDDTSGVTRQQSNAQLNTLFIENVTRSGSMSLYYSMNLALPETTPEHIAEFKAQLLSFLQANPREYVPALYCEVTAHPDVDRCTLYIVASMRNNTENSALFGGRRTRLIQYIDSLVQQIPLHLPARDDPTHNDPALPMYVQQYNPCEMDETAVPPSRKRAVGNRQPFQRAPTKQEESESDTEHAAPAKESFMPTNTAAGFRANARRRAASISSRATATGMRRSNSVRRPLGSQQGQ